MISQMSSGPAAAQHLGDLARLRRVRDRRMAEQLLILGRQAQAVSAVFARRYSSLTPAAGENVEASVRPSCPGTGDLGRSTVFDNCGA